MKIPIISMSVVACLFANIPAVAGPGQLTVISVSPPAHVLEAAPNTAITVTFDRPVSPTTFTSDSMWAFGRWSGTARGTISFSQNDTVATLTPNEWFTAGEQVMVILSHDLQAADGTFLRSAGYSYQFWTRAGRASMQFEEIAEMTTRTIPSESSRAYGGIGSDLNGDRFLDITIVNEDTADLRVFLNQAGGTGSFDPFIQPTFAIGQQASPSEPSDFDRDGNVDICVANIAAGTVSILLGRGNGQFNPQQLFTAGGSPRGIAVLDVDGDGDIDVVNSNFGSNNLSLLTNDGNGVFSAPVFFEAGANGERALVAADMNDDGILDLVVGSWNNDLVLVITGNGDGTFSLASSTAGGGKSWMLVCGDVNGDGAEDVASVNAPQSNGAILLGTGTGQLGAATTYATPSFPLATDLADLDGDGDLDWVTSSFSGDAWRVFRNNGTGGYAFDQDFAAPQAASCSLPIDIDNDGDLDLVLIDELEDIIRIMEQSAAACAGDVDGSGDVGFSDILAIIAAWGDCPACDADVNQDGVVSFADILAVIGQWGGC